MRSLDIFWNWSGGLSNSEKDLLGEVRTQSAITPISWEHECCERRIRCANQSAHLDDWTTHQSLIGIELASTPSRFSRLVHSQPAGSADDNDNMPRRVSSEDSMQCCSNIMTDRCFYTLLYSNIIKPRGYGFLYIAPPVPACNLLVCLWLLVHDSSGSLI